MIAGWVCCHAHLVDLAGCAALPLPPPEGTLRRCGVAAPLACWVRRFLCLRGANRPRLLLRSNLSFTCFYEHPLLVSVDDFINGGVPASVSIVCRRFTHFSPSIVSGISMGTSRKSTGLCGALAGGCGAKMGFPEQSSPTVILHLRKCGKVPRVIKRRNARVHGVVLRFVFLLKRTRSGSISSYTTGLFVVVQKCSV